MDSYLIVFSIFPILYNGILVSHSSSLKLAIEVLILIFVLYFSTNDFKLLDCKFSFDFTSIGTLFLPIWTIKSISAIPFSDDQ